MKISKVQRASMDGRPCWVIVMDDGRILPHWIEYDAAEYRSVAETSGLITALCEKIEQHTQATRPRRLSDNGRQTALAIWSTTRQELDTHEGWLRASSEFRGIALFLRHDENGEAAYFSELADDAFDIYIDRRRGG